MQIKGQGNGLFPGISKPGYVDPFSRIDTQQNQREGDKMQIKGQGKPTITLDENDDDLNPANIMVVQGQRKAQAKTDIDLGLDKDGIEEARKSVQTIISQRQSLSDSQILDAVANVIMQEINGDVEGSQLSQSQKNFTQSVERQIGEDLIMEKINRIFDEVGQDRVDFEESYVSLSGLPNATAAKSQTSSGNQRADVISSSI